MVLPASSLRKFASSPKLNFPANIATPSHLNQHSHTSVYNLGGNKPLSRATSKATSMMNLKATSMVNLKVKDRSIFLCELGMKLCTVQSTCLKSNLESTNILLMFSFYDMCFKKYIYPLATAEGENCACPTLGFIRLI